MCYCWVSLPAACRNAQSIGMAVVLNCHNVRPLHPFLPLFFFKVLFLFFFLSPCQLSLPRPPVGLGENVRGSFKMRSTWEKNFGAVQRMTECLHA